MEWWQVRVDCPADQVEIIANVFEELATGGVQLADQETPEFQVQPGWQAVLAYLPTTRPVAPFLQQLQQRLMALSKEQLINADLPVATKQLNEQDWRTSWQDFYHPLRLTRFLTVVPQWEKYTPATADERLIYLNPGKSFGTGEHTTTQLAAAALELTLRPQMTVFDVGTGSGILSLIAWRLNAGSIAATEIDETALAFTRENLALNQATEAINLHAGSLLAPLSGQADLIVANMLPEALLPLVPQLAAHLRPQGQVIYTGIISAQAAKVRQTLMDAGFTINLTLQQNDWYCFRAQRSSEVAD